MKRFIDLRGQHTGYRFAWWCTIRDEFDRYAGDQAWSTWSEFVESVEEDGNRGQYCIYDHICRYKRLAPAWVHEPDPDDDFEADTVGLERR